MDQPTTPVWLRATVAAAAIAAALILAPASHAATPNTREPGSPCRSQAYTGPAPAGVGGLDTTSLGSSAPASYEIGAPTSAITQGRPVTRVMILVHGGGWFTVGRAAMRTLREQATAWRAAGWQTVSTSHRACGKSIGDVLRTYDLVRRQVGPSVPICLYGQSSGGHLALQVASTRSDVACVIAEGAPTDLVNIAEQGCSGGTRQLRRCCCRSSRCGDDPETAGQTRTDARPSRFCADS